MKINFQYFIFLFVFTIITGGAITLYFYYSNPFFLGINNLVLWLLSSNLILNSWALIYIFHEKSIRSLEDFKHTKEIDSINMVLPKIEDQLQTDTNSLKKEIITHQQHVEEHNQSLEKQAQSIDNLKKQFQEMDVWLKNFSSVLTSIKTTSRLLTEEEIKGIFKSFDELGYIVLLALYRGNQSKISLSETMFTFYLDPIARLRKQSIDSVLVNWYMCVVNTLQLTSLLDSLIEIKLNPVLINLIKKEIIPHTFSTPELKQICQVIKNTEVSLNHEDENKGC